ncbi:hypothetical protein Ancab_008534 [Ancistrocladus abbreviatus]
MCLSPLSSAWTKFEATVLVLVAAPGQLEGFVQTERHPLHGEFSLVFQNCGKLYDFVAAFMLEKQLDIKPAAAGELLVVVMEILTAAVSFSVVVMLDPQSSIERTSWGSQS